MRVFKNILIALLASALYSCTYYIAPPFTSVDKITNLRSGMTIEQVNQTLGNNPYDILYGDQAGEQIVTYRYRRANRRAKLPTSSEALEYLHKPISQTDGEKWYDSEGVAEIKVRFLEGKMVSLISNEGLARSKNTLLTDFDIKFIDQNEVSYIEELYKAALREQADSSRRDYDTVYAIPLDRPMEEEEVAPPPVNTAQYVPGKTQIRNGKALVDSKLHMRWNLGIGPGTEPVDVPAIELDGYGPAIEAIGLTFMGGRFGGGFDVGLMPFSTTTTTTDFFGGTETFTENWVQGSIRFFAVGQYDPTGKDKLLNAYARVGYEVFFSDYLAESNPQLLFQAGAILQLSKVVQPYVQVGTGMTPFALGLSFRIQGKKMVPVEQLN